MSVIRCEDRTTLVPLLGDGLHKVPQELPPCEGVQAGDRLVEQEQLGPLGGRQGEGELGALAAGQRPGPLPEVKAELADAALGELVVPAGVEPAAHPQVASDGEPRVDRRVLGDEADPGELRRGAGRALAQDPDLPEVGSSSPAASCSRVVLPAPFGPTSPVTRPAGTVTVQSASARRRP